MKKFIKNILFLIIFSGCENIVSLHDEIINDSK